MSVGVSRAKLGNIVIAKCSISVAKLKNWHKPVTKKASHGWELGASCSVGESGRASQRVK